MMKIILNIIMTSMLLVGTVQSATTSSMNPELQKTYDDIRKNLGQVPTFVKAFPEESLPAVWEEMKSVQMSASTVLPPKVKELIGLAVAAQIPCQYCTYFHTESAKLNGATEGEIKEAVLMSGAERHWGTFVSGLQYKEEDFRKEVDKMVTHMRDQLTKPKEDIVSTSAASTSRNARDVQMKDQAPATSNTSVSVTPIIDSQTAYSDMEKTYGFVPGFMRMFPENSVAAAWKTLKSIEMSSNAEISPKYKELIGLAVAAQTSCRECIYYHTEAAKVNGASTDEIREALAMSSFTRLMSTVLNGNQIDERKFKQETSQIMKFVKSQSHKKVSMNETYFVKK